MHVYMNHIYGLCDKVCMYASLRDRYGNPIRADQNLFPLGQVNGGTENIQFEVCKNVVSRGGGAGQCGGGEEYTAVGVTITYSMGPDGQTNDPGTGDPYFGLYQIVYFPFDAEPVQPRVLHGDKAVDGEEADNAETAVVKCYFDTTLVEQVRSKMDPGADFANACIQEVAAAESEARRSGLRHSNPLPMIHISAPSNSADESDSSMAQKVTMLESHSSRSPLPPSSSHNARRAVTVVKETDLIVDIETTFHPSNTDLMRKWFVRHYFTLISCNPLSVINVLTSSFLWI